MGISTGSVEDAVSPEALYNQGMAYYRRRQWQQARESFQRLKRVDPNRRGIDALLDELDIFIRLESLEPAALPQEQAPTTTGAQEQVASSLPEVTPLPRPVPRWLLPAVLVSVLALGMAVLLAFGPIVRRTGTRAEELENLGVAQRAAGNWPAAIKTYEDLLILKPDHPEARNSLWICYYEQGYQLAQDAQHLEDQGQYQEAAAKWREALSSYRYAQEVDPARHPDPQRPLAERIAVAEKRSQLATLFAQAEQKKKERRWSEVIQILEALGKEAPDYRSAEVRTYLSEAYLGQGEDALAAAATVAEIQEAVKLVDKAAQIQPSNDRAQATMRRARLYLQGATSYQERQWDAAIKTLSSLVKEEPGYAHGRAREILCQCYLQRAETAEAAGRLPEALADYQAVVDLGECSGQGTARQKVDEVSLALTPTATPTYTPTRTPLPTRAPTQTPVPTATPYPTAVPPTEPPPPRPPTAPPTKDPRR